MLFISLSATVTNLSVYVNINIDIYFKVTQIQPPGNLYCIEPESGGCQPADNTFLVLRPTSTYCNNGFSKFVFNPAAGTLLHNCSGKPVCSKDGYKWGHKMVLDTSCPKTDLRSQIRRTLCKFSKKLFCKLGISK